VVRQQVIPLKRHPTPVRAIGTALCALLWLEGCKVGPNYETPQVLPSETWSRRSDAPLSDDTPQLREWWRNFNDPVLDQLIGQAEQSNAKLEQALANVRVSLGALGVSESQFWPQISLAALYERNKTNISLLAAQGVETSPYNVWGAGAVMASWEVDVWGRVARMVESAKAELEFNVEELRAALITIRAEVGTGYMNVRTLQRQIQLLKAGIANVQTALDVAQRRLTAGTTTALDVAQIQAELDSLEAMLPSVTADLDAAIFAIAELCGSAPGPIKALLENPTPIPTMDDRIGMGIPADLLRRRPDVRASERTAAAAVAMIGANEALNLPVFAISGNIYVAGNQFSSLGNSSNIAYGFGPTVSWLVFSGGYVTSMITQSRAQAQVALAAYRGTVLDAVRDVETTASMLVYSKQAAERATDAVKSYQIAYDLANKQFSAGTIDIDRLVNLQNHLLRAQQLQADADGSVAQNIVALYRALGGGWDEGAVNESALRSADMASTTPSAK
jgi:NodT family efflux transporter outer membrane factor (OMF) lipoprotein